MPNDIDNPAASESMKPEGGEAQSGGQVSLEAVKQLIADLQEQGRQRDEKLVDALSQAVQNVANVSPTPPASPQEPAAPQEFNWQSPHSEIAAIVEKSLGKFRDEQLNPLRQMVGGIMGWQQHQELKSRFKETVSLPNEQINWAFGEVYKAKPAANVDVIAKVREKLEDFIPKPPEEPGESTTPVTPGASKMTPPAPPTGGIPPIAETAEELQNWIEKSHPASKV